MTTRVSMPELSSRSRTWAALTAVSILGFITACGREPTSLRREAAGTSYSEATQGLSNAPLLDLGG